MYNMIVLHCVQVGFAAPEAATGLKLLEAGVPKEKLALIAVPLTPLQIVTPLILRFDLRSKHRPVYSKVWSMCFVLCIVRKCRHVDMHFCLVAVVDLLLVPPLSTSG